MKKSKKIFEQSVKPFFYPLNECYITYSQNISEMTNFTKLSPKQVKTKFKFELLCDDLKKSAEEDGDCFKTNIKKIFSKSSDVAPPHSIIENTLDSFILHSLSKKIGFGISSNTIIKKGSIIAEYVGARTKDIFSDYKYLILTNNRHDIDAKDYGNAARFFNHCPSTHHNKEVLTANVQAMGCSDKQKTKVFFVALRDIKPLEPICWDYLDSYDFSGGLELINATTYLPIGEVGNLTDEL